jgi:hypothetical protein
MPMSELVGGWASGDDVGVGVGVGVRYVCVCVGGGEVGVCGGEYACMPVWVCGTPPLPRYPYTNKTKHKTDRKMFSPSQSKNTRPAGFFPNATPPWWPGAAQLYSFTLLYRT